MDRVAMKQEYKTAAQEFLAQAFSGQSVLTHAGLWISFPYPTPAEAVAVPEEEIFDSIRDWLLQAPSRMGLDAHQVLVSLRQECTCGGAPPGSVLLARFVHRVHGGGDGEEIMVEVFGKRGEETF